MSERGGIIMGIDLGRTTVSTVVGERGPEGGVRVISTSNRRHFGRPLEVFVSEYGKLDPARIEGVAATGVYGGLLISPVLAGIPEDVAQEYAAKKLYPGRALNVFRLGGGGYSILAVGWTGRSRFLENDKCSAGTGEMIEKICGRLGLTLEEAANLAGQADSFIPITSRCSVFAQTEITHYANQGETKDRLLAGYFKNVARSLFALYGRRRTSGPVLMIGQGASIAPIREEFERLAGKAVIVPPEAAVFEALGALHYLAERPTPPDARWPADPRHLLAPRVRNIRPVEPPWNGPGSVAYLPAPDSGARPGEDAILALDLGSTGAKAVMFGRESGAVIADVYRSTLGNPVEAAQSLIEEILAREPRPVAAVAFTGSGREAAAAIFRSRIPQAADRTWVINEIVAHATAAKSLDPDGGKSLTVIEIGGQDAKFINLQDGKIRGSNLNCACSAGTGAFLEEQAHLHGITDHALFSRIARMSQHPPDLGQMCSVFVAGLAVEARRQGFEVQDIFAGLLRSVIVNYQNRVMGRRQLLGRVFFQGKPAQNKALARTLAAVTGREITIPPNPGAMGAIGAAILAREKLGGADAAPLPVHDFLDARVSARRSFTCPDQRCGNVCRLEEAALEVSGQEIKVVSGGACPRYDGAGAGAAALPEDAPKPYRERRELLERTLAQCPTPEAGPELGVPLSLGLVEHLPFVHRYFSRLGFRVKIIASDAETLHRGNRAIGSQGTCTPAKIMHGLALNAPEFLFLPQIVSYRSRFAGVKNQACPLIHSMPAMIAEVLREKCPETTVIAPSLFMKKKGLKTDLFPALLEAAQIALGPGAAKPGRRKALAAFREAALTQEIYEQELWKIGERAIAYGRERGAPVVLVAGNFYVIHEPAMNAGIHNIIAREGAIPLPLDCFPIPDAVPILRRLHLGICRRILRASLAAAMAGGVYPLILASYGCGPLAYAEHMFNDLMESYPHTLIESDGHGGRAGYITRVQAFLHSAREHQGKYSPETVAAKARRYDVHERPSRREMKKAKLVVMGAGPGGGSYGAAIKRSRGFDADPARPEGEEALRLGRLACSGKECLPHSLIWGSFAHYLDRQPPPGGKNVILLNVAGEGPCNNGMFNLVNEISLEKMGLSDRVKITGMGTFHHDSAASSGGWLNIVGLDILNLLAGYYRPDEARAGEADRLFALHAARLEESLLPPRAGRGPAAALSNIGRSEAVIREAAKDFLALEKRGEERRPVVYLCGDIYLRLEQAANDGIVRKLNGLGLRVITQPAGEFFEVLLKLRTSDVLEMETGWLRNKIIRAGVGASRERLVAAAREFHPWIRWEGAGPVIQEAEPRLHAQCFLESITTIGSSLLAWRAGGLDGVLVIAPWGCAAAHVAEAQLSRAPEIPWLFLYHEGGPIDENKLAAFAWRLKNRG